MGQIKKQIQTNVLDDKSLLTSWHDNGPLFFSTDSFLRLGQKYKNIFVGFSIQMKTFKSAFDIN